jgi:hypothetical protein
MNLSYEGRVSVVFRLIPATYGAIGYPEATEAFVVDNSGDSDKDGLPDLWEEKYFGPGNLAQTADGDPDGDRRTNREELAARTDPADGDSYFALQEPEVHPWGVVLTWSSVNGREYRVWSSDDLLQWSVLTHSVPANELDSETSRTIPSATTNWLLQDRGFTLTACATHR